MDPLITDASKQETRAFLRERFLRLMCALNGQEADIFMHEKTNVRGTLSAMDIDVQSLQVSDLQTPIGVLPAALLRLSDVKKISIHNFQLSS